MASQVPFSTDPIDDIPPGDVDYVTKVNDNFENIRSEVVQLHNSIQSLNGGQFNPFLEAGQLEVNGSFILHRRMQEVSRTKIIPVDGPVMNNADYSAVATGAGLGIIGGGFYTYHPTICPGWYAPLELMPASVGAGVTAFGSEPLSGGTGLQIDLPAAPRLNGGTDKSVLFQPISVHNDVSRWAGRPLRAQITYEHDATPGLEPEIYVVWDVGGVRTQSQSSFSNANSLLPATGLGTENTITFDFTPPVASTMLEVGIRFRDPAAHSFVARRMIVSSNLQRDIAISFPAVMPVEQLLIDSHYYRSIQGEDGVDFVPVAATMVAGSPADKQWMADDRRPVINPTQNSTQLRWDAPNLEVYAKPLLVEQKAPHSAVLLASVTDAPTVDILEKPIDPGGVGVANYTDWELVSALYCILSLAALPAGKDFNPDWLVEYDGEWMTNFRPLLLP